MVMIVKAAVMKDTVRRRDNRAKQICMEEDAVEEEAANQFTPTFSVTNVTNMRGILQTIVESIKRWKKTINLALDDTTNEGLLLMAQNEDLKAKEHGEEKDDGRSCEAVEAIGNEGIHSRFGKITILETKKSKKESRLNTQSTNEPKKLPNHQKENRDLEQQPKSAANKFVEKSQLQTLKFLNERLLKEKEKEENEKKDKLSAKDYIIEKLADDDDIKMLEELGQYTLEALIIHVLGIVFNTYESMVCAASLINQLDSSVRTHSRLLKSHSSKKSISNVHMSDKMEKSETFSFGVFLLEFIEERGLVSSITMESFGSGVKKKSKGGYYYESNLFIVCNFDVTLLPIKLNLPMICPPLDWMSACPPNQSPRYLSDLSGGYLSGPTGEIYDRYRLLCSGDLNHFYIYIGYSSYYKNDYKSMCKVMNALQRQPFTINRDWLNHLMENEDYFVDDGLLMPQFLETMNIRDVSPILRDFHMKDEEIYNEFSFNDLLHTVIKTIQRSRYERLILNLARAYDGYKFYLPAFLDFRGRIYRCGILHFHECDLARSLIVFADHNHQKEEIKLDFINDFNNKDNKIISQNITLAKRPFQFAANIYAMLNHKFQFLKDFVPITQDAASSAYKIMSYFLLDESLAERTNLFLSLDNPNQIQDVYLYFLAELKEFMKEELDPNLCSVVCKHLSRKIVKSIFMPIIYGKTVMSTSTDLMVHFSQHLTSKECFNVASVCFKFFKEKYPGMECLIRLIRLIGWVASSRDSAVKYNVSYFTSVQDYMKMESTYIWVYDRLHKKRRRVTLRVSSSKRDRWKTEISTFVNFIHQKDAFIAMKVVEEMLNCNAPVHDNFITTVEKSRFIPMAYLEIFHSLGPPLSIINKFIYINVIENLKCINSFDYENHVISKEYLTEFKNIPENISKQNQILWDKKINEIVTCYSHYVKKKYAEVYDGDYIVRLMIRVYMDSKKKEEDRPSPSEEERYNTLSSIIEGKLSEIEEPITARKIKHELRQLNFPVLHIVKEGVNPHKACWVIGFPTQGVNPHKACGVIGIPTQGVNPHN
ncbi:uncharacterized protein LOC111473779 [Cucurbita maxima]|uniref:DNA-directed RNA polymerase n=1 Tax=Cucurbita maxima TaxID=3661 RepID=A0A6J1IJ21_CUCMA|nr:uncharacterized protein LOC111473779 [Cucurbita maxima]